MNTTPRTNSRRDSIISIIGVLVLLIGMATGNALLMLAMATVALAVFTLMYRQTMGRITLLTLATSLLIASVLAVVIARL